MPCIRTNGLLGEIMQPSLDGYVIFDIEATGVDPDTAEIIEIAAVAGNTSFHRYVLTQAALPTDHEVWAITNIDQNEYNAQAVPLQDALQEFLEYVADSPLAGHNIYQYDLPLIARVTKSCGFTRKPNIDDLDSLRWALLMFPKLPESLSGYTLGSLHRYLLHREPDKAHRALHDCYTNREVMLALQKVTPPAEVLNLWARLRLPEAALYQTPPNQGNPLEQKAMVPMINQGGKAFPESEDLERAGLLERRRESQMQMMAAVTEAVNLRQQLIVQAPTGTGKTRGYLYPLHHHQSHTADSSVAVVATHTKVLQQQAMEELRRLAAKGYATKAVIVKSASDYLCLDALQELIEDSKEADREERYALGMLAHYAHLGQYDLEAIPSNWSYLRAYREIRFHVETRSSRCRNQCPFYSYCAYQTDLSQRAQANFWVTNQAWLIAHFGGESEDENPNQRPLHLVIDEAHNLEDVATGAFTFSLNAEDFTFHLNRLYDDKPKRPRGLLRDNPKMADGQETERIRELLRRIKGELLPQIRKVFDEYSEQLSDLIKQFGQGDKEYGVRLTLASSLKTKNQWARLRAREKEWLLSVEALRSALREIPWQSELGRNLQPTIRFLDQVIELIYQRNRVMRDEQEDDNNYVHLSEWTANQGWTHLALPVEVATRLQALWSQASSAVLTSATLSVGGNFDYIKRTLGLQTAQVLALPETLPYHQAHVVIPGHLPEARGATLARFQAMYHRELKVVLPASYRSLSLFTSLGRLKAAANYLDGMSGLYKPLTRREREDVALSMQKRDVAAAALGSRSFMEGVDFPNLKTVNLERIPFPVPSTLLQRRQELAEQQGLDPWRDVYLPRAVLSFVQAFGRLIRDDRQEAKQGAFVLWDKRLRNAVYQMEFLGALPKGVNLHWPKQRGEFYDLMAQVLELPRDKLPREELRDEYLERLWQIRQEASDELAAAKEIARVFWQIPLGQDARSQKQLEAIQAALNNQDLLVLLPTGFGKSLTFQLPALVQGGLSLVVSPLIALMQDQVRSLLEKGLPAAALHSNMGASEQKAVMDEVRAGRINLLYMSPERLNRSQDVKTLLQELAQGGQLRRLILDEAHCLSEWGHDFRPDYSRAAKVVAEISDLPITALTATATPEVVQALCESLQLHDPVTVKSSYDRPNLHYFTYQATEIKKVQRLVQILDHLREHHPGDPVIVYTATRNQTERLAWFLQKLGYSAEAYHAGLSPIIREEVQGRFMEGQTSVMVATSAFGMGVDKANVRAVVHFNPPSTLESYLQEAGRAGRDGQVAFAVMLFTRADWNLQAFMNNIGRHLEVQAQTLLNVLRSLDRVRGVFEKDLMKTLNQQLELNNTDNRSVTLQEGQLPSLLASLQEAKLLDFDYRLGRVRYLCSEDQAFENSWQPGELQLLESCRVLPEPNGVVELNLALLPRENAEAIDRRLYELKKQGVLRVYYTAQPALSLTFIKDDLAEWRSQMDRNQQSKEARLEKVKTYATSGHCKRYMLLQAFEEQLAGCEGCQNCNDGDAPWHAQMPHDVKYLEAIYKPLETLLLFMRSHEGTNPTVGYQGIGQTKIIMALKGEERNYEGVNLRWAEINNPYFGRLAFIREREIRKELKHAVERGYLHHGSYEQFSVYRISQQGKDYLMQQARSTWKRGGRV